MLSPGISSLLEPVQWYPVGDSVSRDAGKCDGGSDEAGGNDDTNDDDDDGGSDGHRLLSKMKRVQSQPTQRTATGKAVAFEKIAKPYATIAPTRQSAGTNE